MNDYAAVEAMKNIPDDERKPFEVRDYLDRPEVIESYIGDLLVLNDRLRSVLDQIGTMAFDVMEYSRDKPPSKE